MAQPCSHRRCGFTLVELLVVVATIAMLIGILMPSLRAARESGRMAECLGQLRQISNGFSVFALDHHQILPSVHYSGVESWQRPWLGNEVRPGVAYEGTLAPYVGSSPRLLKQLYRCPSLEEGPRGRGVGSNGLFDYASLIAFAGAKISLMPTSATVRDPITLKSTHTPVPLIVEEDPNSYLNRNVEPGHANVDRLGTWHGVGGGGGNYASFDGSAHHLRFARPSYGPTPVHDWTVITPSGAEQSLHHGSTGFGDWNKR